MENFTMGSSLNNKKAFCNTCLTIAIKKQVSEKSGTIFITIKKKVKNEFNARKHLRIKEINIKNLVLLYNTKLKFQFSHKLDFY